jgi:hypothetical protein
LPGQAQAALAERYPVDIYRCTIWSCWGEVALGVYLIFFGGVLTILQDITGGGDPLLPATLLFVPSRLWVALSPYLILEGLARWRYALRGRLYGSLPLELLWRLLP